PDLVFRLEDRTRRKRQGQESARTANRILPPRRRRQGHGADGAARDLRLGAGNLDVAQAPPAIDEAARPRRGHVARLAERDGEAAAAEVAEVIDRAIADTMHRLERIEPAELRRRAIERLAAAVGRE